MGGTPILVKTGREGGAPGLVGPNPSQALSVTYLRILEELAWRHNMYVPPDNVGTIVMYGKYIHTYTKNENGFVHFLIHMYVQKYIPLHMYTYTRLSVLHPSYNL